MTNNTNEIIKKKISETFDLSIFSCKFILSSLCSMTIGSFLMYNMCEMSRRERRSFD